MKSLVLVNISRGFEKGIMPLGLVSIATYLKKYGNLKDITLLDANCQDIYKKMKSADIVGISSVTQDISRAVHFARFVKERYRAWVILGGVHISTYRRFPDSCFDIGVLGEGEQTMLELAQLDTFTNEKLSKISGICFGDNGKTIFTPPRDLIRPLDSIPIADRDITDLDFYLKRRQIIPYYKGRSLTIMTSRGCPFNCSFCSTRVHWGGYRSFSAERVVEEIGLLVSKYKAEIIHVFDDIFIADKERLVKIHDALIKNKLNKKIKFMCLARSDMLDEDVMGMLKAMNVVITGVGMESGCQRILDYLKNHTATIQKNRDAIELSNKYKIPVMGSFMVGNPRETENEIIQTLEFIKSYRYSPFLVPLVYISTPFPGTDFWSFAEAQGLNISNFDNLVMDIPKSQDRLKEMPLLNEVPADKFFQILQLFKKEMRYGRVKGYIFFPQDIFSLFKAYALAILAEKNFLKGIKEVNRIRKFAKLTKGY